LSAKKDCSSLALAICELSHTDIFEKEILHLVLIYSEGVERIAIMRLFITQVLIEQVGNDY